MGVRTGAVLRAVLAQSGTALNALVGDRIWIGRYPTIERFDNSAAAIVGWRIPGGVPQPELGLKRPRYRLDCLGGSDDPDDTEEVYDALQELLYAETTGHNVETSHGLLISSEEIFGLSGWDDFIEERGWWAVKSHWEFEITPLDP